MPNSQVLVHRTRDVDVDNLLARFIETLLDVEAELQDANDGQWDTIVRDACRTRTARRSGSALGEHVQNRQMHV